MFDLEKAIAAWRRPFEHDAAFSDEDVEELESSLRDRVESLVEVGQSKETAFREALGRMGSYARAEEEYRKVYWGKLKRRRQLLSELVWRLSMLKNYLTIALRNLLRHKGYSFINIAGLTLGMACCLLLFQYVAFETSFDQFNTKKDQLYRATFPYTRGEGQEGISATNALAFGPTMAQEVPGIVRYARIHPSYGGAVISYPGASDSRTFTEDHVLLVDTTFFGMFDYPLVKGDRSRVLRQPQTMLVSESMARKYFGDEEPVGKTLEVTWWESGTYAVAGVFEDVPSTSHLQFDFLFPLSGLLNSEGFQGEGAAWRDEFFITYLEVDEHVNIAALERQISETYGTSTPGLASGNIDVKVQLQPLTDIHLNQEIYAPATRTGDRRLVYFFAIIGLITLVIALVNYVNLATARAINRAREVGVRKVVGAYRNQLMGQFMLESALTNILALVLAITLSMLLLPVVNRVAAVEMSRDLWLNGRFWAAFLGLFGLGALLSGLYPAFILSSFKPVTVLKGKAGAFASRVALRKVLVVVQFTASIALLAGTTIVYSQLSYMRGMDTGLDLEQVLVVEGPRVRSDVSNRAAEMSTLKNELRRIPAVQEIGLSSNTPGRGFSMYYGRTYRVGADPSTGQLVLGTYIDKDFPGVYGLELVAGQPFYEGMTVPDSGDVPIMVNETFVQTLGFSSNEEAVNERIAIMRNVYVVKGVYEDFQWSSAHQEREAVLFHFEPGGGSSPGDGSISMKVSTQELPGTIAAVEKVYESILPGNPFHYHFADAAFDEQYRADRRFATLFAGFAGIAIIIACLGLFGLVAFTAAQRTTEIGVRKVLGASVGSIVALLSGDFLKLVGLAFLIATPLAYFGMQRWLEGFAYRIELGPRVFLLTGTLVLLVALLTVSYQSIRAALADPVKSLHYN